MAGRGIQLSDGVRAGLERGFVDGVADVGLIVGGSENLAWASGTVSIDDLVVRKTRSRSTTLVANVGPVLRGGHGVSVDSGAQVTLRRAVIDGNQSMGLTAVGWRKTPETRLVVEDVAVLNTEPEACVSADVAPRFVCVDDDGGHTGGGSGLVAMAGARIDIDRFTVRGNALTGLYFDSESVIRADHGEIRGNAIGIYAGGGQDAISNRFGDVLIYDNDTEWARSQPLLPDPARVLEF